VVVRADWEEMCNGMEEEVGLEGDFILPFIFLHISKPFFIRSFIYSVFVMFV
jgi:hypothetical protein